MLLGMAFRKERNGKGSKESIPLSLWLGNRDFKFRPHFSSGAVPRLLIGLCFTIVKAESSDYFKK